MIRLFSSAAVNSVPVPTKLLRVGLGLNENHALIRPPQIIRNTIILLLTAAKQRDERHLTQKPTKDREVLPVTRGGLRTVAKQRNHRG